MKIDLTYKEANLLAAIIWELAVERAHVTNGGESTWRLSATGRDLAASVADKLEEANAKVNAKKGQTRDLSGAPRDSIQEARWA